MSNIGQEIDLDILPKSFKLLRQLRKQRDLKENTAKFGKLKLGVHGQELP